MKFLKDPHARLDFMIDWSQWLNSDTIISSEWVLPDGADDLIVNTSEFTATTATVWISGGLADKKYLVANRITTAAGRIDDRSIQLTVKNR